MERTFNQHSAHDRKCYGDTRQVGEWGKNLMMTFQISKVPVEPEVKVAAGPARKNYY